MEQSLCLVNKVVIRVADVPDLPKLFEMVDLYEGMDIDRNKTKNYLRDILYAGGVFLAEYNGETIGGIAAYVLPCMFNANLMFVVMFFFVKKEFRALTKAIVKELELVLTPTQVNQIMFGFVEGPDQPKYLRFMRMLGYKNFETHMAKRI